ncbi:MAG: glycosyltransferase family 2 protein [Desulfuromonadales bacterium]|nr:glycosyltransferase family 2 protein [Desulfuromonadales bacterium]
MEITVIICTYNRADSLSRCLTHLGNQEVPQELSWEVLVVDNNSDDHTSQIVEKAAQDLKGLSIRYVKETNQGLSFARNRGIEEARGRLLAFIDDDILTTSGWLAAIYAMFLERGCDAVGGRIHLDESLVIPPWIKPDMYGFLGYQDFGDQPFQMDGINDYPFGGNMAFTRTVVKKIGPFNVNLGRKGDGSKNNELFKGEETDFFHRLTKASGEIFYQPGAIVYHQILPFQLQKKYFRSIHFNSGYQDAFYDQDKYERTFYGIPLFLFTQIVSNVGKYFIQLFTRGPNEAFRQEMNVGYFLGRMVAYARKGSC